MTQASEQSDYLRLKAKVWLSLAAILAMLWLVLWFRTDTTINLAIKERQQSKEMTIPTKMNDFVDFRTEVPPISFDTITRDLRNYPDEFKDKAYFQHYQKKWTVQVMDVAEHKVILDYLDGRDDRKKFAYFRYADQNNKTRYLLTYGIMSTFQEAMGAAKIIDFQLPKSTRVLPEEMKRYVDMIDNYQRGNAVGNHNKVQAVTLQETSIEVPPAPAKIAPPPTNKTPEVVETQDNTPPAQTQIQAERSKTPVEQFEENKRIALAKKNAKEAMLKAQENARQSEQTLEQKPKKTTLPEYETNEGVAPDEY